MKKAADFLEEFVLWEITLCDAPANPRPDLAGAQERLTRLAELARKQGKGALAAKAENAAAKYRARLESSD